MPFCRKCGAQLGEDEKVCPSCGISVSQPEARAKVQGSERSEKNIVLLAIGAIILVVGIIALVGGIIFVGIGGQGFRIKPTPLKAGSYAITLQDINLDLSEVSEDWGAWRSCSDEYASVKLTGSNKDSSKNIFLGIAKDSDLESYLEDVEYDEIVEWRSFKFSPFRPSLIEVEYDTHSGSSKPIDPTSETFWTASVHGSGTQTLEWEPETGNYWVVLMNEDGSEGIDSDLTLAVKIPFLPTIIGGVLLAGGIVGLIIGGILIYLGVRKKV